MKNMPISILDLSRKPEGTTETRAIHFDTLEDVELAEPVEGEVVITTYSPQHFAAHVRATAVVERECGRCLKHYLYPVELSFNTEFADSVDDAEWPIDKNIIDLAEPTRQEILLRLPMKSLCTPDCKGILDNTN